MIVNSRILALKFNKQTNPPFKKPIKLWFDKLKVCCFLFVDSIKCDSGLDFVTILVFRVLCSSRKILKTDKHQTQNVGKQHDVSL